MSAPRHDPLDRRPANAARTIVFLAREFERTCQEARVSLPQYRLLLFLRDGPKRAGELAARVAIKRPTLTALVAGLERAGHLRRVSVEQDGRGIHIEITEKGEQAVERAESRLSTLVERLANKGRRESILESLDELSTILDGEIERRIGEVTRPSSSANPAETDEESTHR